MKTVHKTSTAPAVRTVGVANPAKIELYDAVAQFLADRLGAPVSHVKPRSFKDEETGKTRKTGSYGLAFEFEGTIATLEVVLKNDTATMDDFIVEAETAPAAR